MTKVVINRCYGGFSLSDEAMVRYADLKGTEKRSLYQRDLSRDDPILVQVVEEMKEKASGFCARLEVIDIPKGTLYRIDEYDGKESIETRYDDTEWKVA